jgi:hypothetical protein
MSFPIENGPSATGQSSDNQMEYSLGVLIVLLIVFWYMCKTIGGCSQKNTCGQPVHINHCATESMDGDLSYLKQARSDPGVIPVKLKYGNTPLLLGSKDGYKLIRTMPSGDVSNPFNVEVPNSKTAMRRLYDDEPLQPTNRDEAMSSSFADMHILKQTLQTERDTPASVTNTRGMVHASQ